MTTELPSISLVTPSLNQGAYLDQAIRSVLAQNYPDLEYIVVDGGSSDSSRDTIKGYANRLAWWICESDEGQYDALNKGFARSTGEIMGWLNADDMHLPWTLKLIARVFAELPEVEWLTTLLPIVWDKDGCPIRCRPRIPFSRRGFFRGDNLPGMGWYASGWIQQESTFWRRSLWLRASERIDSSVRLAADFDLWARFFAEADLHGLELPIAGFRRHADQKTSREGDKYKSEALSCLLRHGGRSGSRIASGMALWLRRALPNRLKPLAFGLGALAPGKVCVFDGDRDRWMIAEA